MSRQSFEGDPIEQLRRADPLNRLEVPNDTNGAQARALFQEVTSMDVMEQEPIRRQRAWARPVAIAASVMAVVALAVGAYAVFGQNDTPEEIVVGTALGGGAQMCIQYEDAILLGLDVAFDGTLVSVETIPGSGDIDFPQNLATFEVHKWFKGGEGDTITLDAGILVDDGSITLVGTQIEVGERYLISGEDGFVWACGYSYSYDTEVANHWAELFGA